MLEKNPRATGSAVVVKRGVVFPLDAFNRWKYRHPRVAAVACVADAVREVVPCTAGVRPDRAVTVHAGTGVDRFAPAAADRLRVREELGLDAGHLLVGTVSARAWKGWRETAEAVAAAGRPELRLVVVGCEPDARARVLDTTRAHLGGRVVSEFSLERPLDRLESVYRHSLGTPS